MREHGHMVDGEYHKSTNLFFFILSLYTKLGFGANLNCQALFERIMSSATFPLMLSVLQIQSRELQHT